MIWEEFRRCQRFEGSILGSVLGFVEMSLYDPGL